MEQDVGDPIAMLVAVKTSLEPIGQTVQSLYGETSQALTIPRNSCLLHARLAGMTAANIRVLDTRGYWSGDPNPPWTWK